MGCAGCGDRDELSDSERHRVVGWRVWYADGSVFSSTDTEWRDLPDDGVQVVVLYYRGIAPDGHPLRRIIMGADQYWSDGESYDGVNDPPEKIVARYPGALVKAGKTVPDHLFHGIKTRALSAREWP